MVETQDRHAHLADWLALAFWPLWALVLVLQLLDVGSVALVSLHGAPIHELNPVMLDLMARLGTMAALLVKLDRKSTRLNSSHYSRSRMPSSA